MYTLQYTSLFFIAFISLSFAYNPRVTSREAQALNGRNAEAIDQAGPYWQPQMRSPHEQSSNRDRYQPAKRATGSHQAKAAPVQVSNGGKFQTKEEMLKTPLGRPLTPAEIKANGRATQGNQCKKLVDCKCPTGYGSCFNGNCKCGDANKDVDAVAKAFATPVLEGLAIAGKELQKVVGGLEFAVKAALKIGSWFIPGLGKAAATALDKAIPLTGTGDKKADEIMGIIGKVL